MPCARGFEAERAAVARRCNTRETGDSPLVRAGRRLRPTDVGGVRHSAQTANAPRSARQPRDARPQSSALPVPGVAMPAALEIHSPLCASGKNVGQPSTESRAADWDLNPRGGVVETETAP